jgi:hypothetical protein
MKIQSTLVIEYKSGIQLKILKKTSKLEGK